MCFIYVDGVEVYVWNDVHYQLESDGRTLRLVGYREFVRDLVLSMNLSPTAAWELPLIFRAERTLRVRREHQQFLGSFGPKARVVLDALLDKFTEHGAEELSARALRVPPFSEMGNVIELGGLFGGRDALHEAIDDLGRHLFA